MWELFAVFCIAYAFVLARLARRACKSVPISLERSVFLFKTQNLPKKFQWRRDLLVEVRSQKGCSACWSFVVAEMLADQLAIMSGGQWKENLSAQYLLSCSTIHYGCALGGSPEDAYDLPQLTNSGIPLEKDLNYAKAVTACPVISKNAVRVKTVPGASVELCADPSIFPFFLKGWIIRKNGETMKRALLEYGPIAGTLAITQDLYDFKGNSVFRASKGSRVIGMHACEIVGWDEESWIIRNSYGTDWGDEGYGRIAMGTNESAIESRASVTRVSFPDFLKKQNIENSANYSF